MKKILLFIGVVFLFSGCTANYNISIKNDNTVIENNEIVVKDDIKKVKSDFENSYEDSLKAYNYKYSFTENNDSLNIKFSKESSMGRFTNNSFASRIFNQIEYFKNDEVNNFKTVGFNSLGELFVEEGFEEEYLIKQNIDELRINITFEGEVLSSDADVVNKNTNTYTWIFNRKNYNKKGIKFSYNTSKKIKTIKSLNTPKNEKTFELDEDVVHIFSIAGLVVIIVVLGILFMFKRFSRVNKM